MSFSLETQKLKDTLTHTKCIKWFKVKAQTKFIIMLRFEFFLMFKQL